jgi:Tol biopolymer transport system component
MTRAGRRWSAMCLIGLVMLAGAPAAEATFNGTNGKIAFQSGTAIATVNADGTGFLSLGGGPCQNLFPAWSPDGAQIAYSREASPCAGNYDLAIMNADGTNQHVIAGAATGALEQQPTWSRDGTKIAYFLNGFINSIPAAGGAPTQLSNPNTSLGQFDVDPEWVPSGAGDRILFERDNSSSVGDIWSMLDDGSGEGAVPIASFANNERAPSYRPDGVVIAMQRDNDIWLVNAGNASLTNLTNTAAAEGSPAWSPDATKIAFQSSAGIETMNADGSGRTVVRAGGSAPSWQRLTTYVRPVGASPTRIALVPAFDECHDTNATDTLPAESCVAPEQSSDYLTIGTADANRKPTKSEGFVLFKSITGDPVTPADEADLQISASITDVRKKSDLSDYTGATQAVFTVKKTARESELRGSTGHTLGGTDSIFNMFVSMPCVATADTTVGSTCAVTTTADALGLPIVEGKRTIWQMKDLIVLDGGSDGNPETGPNTVFEEPGNFIP